MELISNKLKSHFADNMLTSSIPTEIGNLNSIENLYLIYLFFNFLF